MNIQQLPAMIKREIPNAKMPVQYDEACKALAECRAINEAKYWGDKSEALAAWAKIYRSEQAAIESRRLKLHAYRRMGELAAELRPVGSVRESRKLGPASVLRENGLSNSQADAALKLKSMQQADFEKIVARQNPPTPGTVLHTSWRGTDSWKLISSGGASAGQFRSFCRRHPAADLARSLSADEATLARPMIRELFEWLDEFEQHLPK